MSKGAKRSSTPSEVKAPTIDKVVTFATSDEITFTEALDPPTLPGKHDFSIIFMYFCR